MILLVAGNLSFVHQDGWFKSYANYLQRQLSHPVLIFLVSVFSPVLLLLILDHLVSYRIFGLTGFFLSLIIFLYALGRGDLDDSVNHFIGDLERDDLQAAYHDAAVFNEGHREGEADSWGQLHDEAVAAIGYRYFEHYFVVIFWFLVGGPATALLYRLTQIFAEQSSCSEKTLAVAHRFLWLLEWLPLRVLGFTLAVVGNFVSCMRPWLDSMVDFTSSSQKVVGQLVFGALDVEYQDETAGKANIRYSLEISAIRELFKRALIATICLVGIVIIFG